MLSAEEFLRPLKPLYDAPRMRPQPRRGFAPKVMDCFREHPDGLYTEAAARITGIPAKNVTWVIADNRELFEAKAKRGNAYKWALKK